MRYAGALLVMGFLSWMGGLFGCSTSSPEDPLPETSRVDVTAQLNHLIKPIDRGERYEDPLDEALRKRGLGETDGGGTMMLQSGEIEYIDVEIILRNKEEGIPFVIEKLEAWGAPKGSVLRVRDTEPPREIPFGKTEGVAVYLDGVGLPDEVYASSDVNVVIEEFNKLLKGHGELQSHWQGPRETALYLYGDDAEVMKRRIAEFMNKYPLCKGASVVTIAPKAAQPAGGGPGSKPSAEVNANKPAEAQKSEMSIEQAIDSFRKAANEKGDFCEDMKRDHALHAAMSEAFHCLCEHGDRGRKAFEALLEDKSPHVSSWVAAQLLSEGDSRAVPVLEQFEKDPGMIGFDAKMTLKEHRAGRLGSPFPRK